MKVLIFGTGYIYEKNKHKLIDFDILAFLDNDVKKQGYLIDGIAVVSPEKHSLYEYDAIIIASTYFSDMREQLLRLGVSNNKIIDEKHLGVFAEVCIIHEYKSLISCNTEGKRILFVASELTNVGATIVLYNAAQLLMKNGYRVDLVTCIKGPMLYSFVSLGVSVKVAEWWDMFDADLFQAYDLVFLNSILTYPIAQILAATDVPVLWWWHEDLTFINILKVKKEDIPCAENIHVLSVGKRVEKAFGNLTGCDRVEELCFGLEEQKYCTDKKIGKKIICAIIGAVSEVKGQDLLLKAIETHQEEWNDKIEYWIIGDIDNSQRDAFEEYSCIKIWGKMEHEYLMKLFSEIDIVLCASRCESMSAAIIEGMMNRKICITSSETGIAEYCEPYVNALIMESGSADSLAEQINWILQHKESWKNISEAGYEVYNSRFRMELFEEKLLHYVNKYCL